MVVETEPCGQPLPEYEALAMVICVGSGVVAQPSPLFWAIGEAATSAGRMKDANDFMLTVENIESDRSVKT
jgi:hypothetical protein